MWMTIACRLRSPYRGVTRPPGMLGRAYSRKVSTILEPAGPLRVLVVDDDATVAEVVQTYLLRGGFVVDRAADGAQALAAAVAAHPDLVVLDLTLPAMDGLEVCRRLRAACPELPVVILTARGDEDD